MKKRSKYPPIVRFLLFTTITVIIWVTFEVYRSLTIEPDPVVPEEILAPLDPTLDSTRLDELQRRVNLSEEEIGETVLLSPDLGEGVVVSPTPTDEPELTPVSTESGELSI